MTDKMPEVFTKEEVKHLQDWQDAGCVHEFTCGNDKCRSALVPTVRGWICQYCDYTQNWAHDFMKDGALLAAQKEALQQYRAMTTQGQEGENGEQGG